MKFCNLLTDVVVADIETTGLSPKTSAVILGGALVSDGHKRLAVQFFADNVDDEPELLRRYVSFLCSNDVIVTYNGASFDIAFLVKRMKHHGMDAEAIESLYSLDMYRILKKHSHLPEILPDMRQKTVELYLGDADSRTDEISGAQSVELYWEYTVSRGQRRAELMDLILLHNRDDIVRLSDMLRIFKILDMHCIMFDSGFQIIHNNLRIRMEKHKMKKNHIELEGRVSGLDSDFKQFGQGYVLEAQAKSGKLKLEVEYENVEGFAVVDLSQLGLEDEEIRSLGGYESGYLILKDINDIRYREINTFAKKLITSLLG